MQIEGMRIPSEAVLVTMDVASLYTSIPHNDAHQVLESALDSHDNLQPPMFFLVELINIVFNKSYFRFNYEFYFQTTGVVMGRSCPPCVANLFMAQLGIKNISHPDHNCYYNALVLIRDT